MKFWRWAVLTVLLISSLVLVGCSPASPSLDTAASRVADYAESSDHFSLKLPPIYVQYDNDGVLGVAGITTNDLYRWFRVDLRGLNLQPRVVAAFVQANIQHIEIAQGAEGLALYVNGQPLPYVAWDGESLRNVGELLPGFGVPFGQVIGKVLPLLQYTQLDLVIQFPVPPGAELIPFRPRNAPAVVAARAEAVEGIGGSLQMDISYDEEGMPSLFGLDPALLRAVGIDVRPLALNPNLVRTLMQANVQHIHLVNRPDGIHIYVNNKALPYVAWGDEHLNTALDLFTRMSGVGDPRIVTLVNQLLSGMRASNVDLLLRFPVPEGAEPIPVLEPPAQ